MDINYKKKYLKYKKKYLTLKLLYNINDKKGGMWGKFTFPFSKQKVAPEVAPQDPVDLSEVKFNLLHEGFDTSHVKDDSSHDLNTQLPGIPRTKIGINNMQNPRFKLSNSTKVSPIALPIAPPLQQDGDHNTYTDGTIQDALLKFPSHERASKYTDIRNTLKKKPTYEDVSKIINDILLDKQNGLFINYNFSEDYTILTHIRSRNTNVYWLINEYNYPLLRIHLKLIPAKCIMYYLIEYSIGLELGNDNYHYAYTHIQKLAELLNYTLVKSKDLYDLVRNNLK